MPDPTKIIDLDLLTAAEITSPSDVYVGVSDRQGTPASKRLSVDELLAVQETISYQGLLLDGDTIDFDTNGRRLSYDINDDADVTLTSSMDGNHSLILRYTEGLKFDSSNDIVTTGTGGPDFNWNDPWTLMAWINTTDHTSDTGFIVGKRDAAGLYGLYLGLSSSRIFMSLRYGIGSNNQMTRNSEVCACNDGTWRHVAITWSGVANADPTYYLDGVEVADQGSGTHNVSTGSGSASWFYKIGANTTSNVPFGGRIKHAKVFDSELSLSDINLAMRNKQTSAGTLLCHWPIDEGTGSTVENIGTLDLDGTLNGPVWNAEGSYSLTSTGVTNLPSSVSDSTKVSLTRENGRWYS